LGNEGDLVEKRTTMVPNVRDIAGLPVDRLPPQVRVEPVTRAAEVTIRPPGSKSLTNRALLLAALAEGTSTLTGALVEADDAQVMIRALRELGAEIEITPEHDSPLGERGYAGEPSGNATLRVRGVGGRWKLAKGQSVTLNLNNAGTATRFLTAAAILQPPDAGGIVIDGNERMRQRPIGELVDAMNAAGLRVDYVGEKGFPPVRVWPVKEPLEQPIEFEFGVTQSSQFVSAVMMLGPFLPFGVAVKLPPNPTSAGYVRMTHWLLECFGAARSLRANGTIHPFLRGGRVPTIPARVWEVEPDQSAATYFLAAGALLAVLGSNIVTWFGSSANPSSRDWISYSSCSTQPDALFRDWLDTERWRRSRPTVPVFDLDMTDMPDAAMTAAVLACFADGTSTLRGLRTLRVKETDRIAAMVTELGKVGVVVEPFAYVDPHGQQDEGIRITPSMLASGSRGIDCSRGVPEVVFHTYDDHRMAMSLALIGLRRPSVIIDDPACVRKTYPTYWRDLAKLYG
jgi:3-phosphoshikimate 1-carboxyvinyltransferase